MAWRTSSDLRQAIGLTSDGSRAGRFVHVDDHRTEEDRASDSDEALVRATLLGDDEALARLVQRYLRKAMAVAMEYAETREDAEDIVQDTFRRMLDNLDRFDATRRFAPWFFTILRNTARNAVRSRRVRQHDALPTEYPAPAPSPFDDTSRLELRARIEAAVERLPPMQQTCFRLCLVEGLSNAEVASALGLAESTVRVHVFQARRALQGLLDSLRDEVREA